MKNGNNVDDIKAAQARVAAAQATVNIHQIFAPFSGTITKATVLSGDRVSSGQSAFRIDDLSHFMVDLQISEVDINSVDIGQSVTITLEAIPNKIYNGIVSSVNQSAKPGQGGINFKVSITLTDPDVAEDVKPGMTASVTITVKEINSTLLVPNRAVRMDNGQRIIYILRDNQQVPIIIRLGSTANDFSQVVGGDLKEGDMIILNPPNLAASS